MVRAFLVPMLLGLVTPLTWAGEVSDSSSDRTLSPYFFVHGDGAVEQLPLKSTDVGIDIAGVIADVRVTQRYRNDGQAAIEAQYVFPGSTRAAVYGLTMTIGERRVVAEIREKKQARAEYQAAKSQGKSAALLEQHRPNVFKMNVANIMPGDEIVVELRYTELIVPTDGTYEFVYPTVVGPRYVSPAEQAAPVTPADAWQASPYLHADEDPIGDFKLRATINSPIALKRTASPSHQVRVAYPDPRRANIELQSVPGNGPNKDFILRYQLAGSAIEAGLMLYEQGDEKYFLAMIEPPKRVPPGLIPPRDYLFIVDVSGSMHGFPLEVSKALMHNLLSGLKDADTFNVLLFAGDSSVLSPAPLPATRENIERAIELVNTQSGGGGTNLLPALQRALDMPGGADRSRNVVIVTDGYVSVETQSFDLIRERLGQANVHVFGIGSSVNRFLIEGMARVGRGEPFVATNEQEAEARAEELRRYIESPLLTHTRLSAQGFELYDIEPPGIPDTLASRPVIVFGKWRGKRDGTLRIDGLTGAGKFTQSLDVARIRPSDANAALRYLWARSRIARLDDYQRLGADPERVEEITRLGLQYHLLTNYTSFIAVDHVPRNPRPEDANTVRQPLPMPEGVSDHAVGGALSTTPEPELIALLGIAGAVAAWARRRRKDARAA
jgi:Ca-activated chloride channel family protein